MVSYHDGIYAYFLKAYTCSAMVCMGQCNIYGNLRTQRTGRIRSKTMALVVPDRWAEEGQVIGKLRRWKENCLQDFNSEIVEKRRKCHYC